jgi:APA family basic amino acid/polyamine antiporter
LRSGLGLGSAAALVVASMVGAGVFTTAGFLLADLGSPAWVMAAWVAGAAIAACGALCYGALARALPGSGGEYHYLSRGFHPAAGALAGWISLLAGFAAPAAAAALGLQAYAAPLFGAGVRAEWIGSAAIVAACALHGLRVAPGVWVQNLAVAAKLAALLAVVLLGAFAAPAAPAEAPAPSAPALPAPTLGAFLAGLVWISFSYSGWNAAVYLGAEVRDPARNLPRALLLGLAAVAALYFALHAVILGAAPPQQLAGRADVVAAAAERMHALAPALVRAAAALALLTSLSALIQSGPRVVARMAEDGALPRVLAPRAPGAAPLAATALQGGLALALVWAAGLRDLLAAIGFLLGLCAAAAVAVLLRLRAARGAAAVPVPGWPWTPALFLAATLASSAFLVAREPRHAAWALLAAAAGWLLQRRGCGRN